MRSAFSQEIYQSREVQVNLDKFKKLIKVVTFVKK